MDYTWIMAVTAHPDDMELGCSGTLLMEKKAGRKVAVIDLTVGELGSRGTGELRLQEAAAAAKIMEVDARENMNLPDGFFDSSRENVLKMITLLRKYRPGIVLTNAPFDRHPDHGRGAHLLKEACFLSGLRKIETTCEGRPQEHWRPYYLFNIIQDTYHEPDFVYDISPVMDIKLEAIKAYGSQFNADAADKNQTYISDPSFLEGIIQRDAALGRKVGVKYGEGFLSEKMLAISNFESLVLKTT